MNYIKGQKDMTTKDKSLGSEGVQYATGEWRRITNRPRMNEEAGPRQIQHSVVDVSVDESKIRCCKEQYYIGTWNVRSINQGKLDVVKQEMVRIKIDILGISELKLTGMGEFNSDDRFIYYCGQESHRRNGVAHIIAEKVKNMVLVCNIKNDRMICVCLFTITVIQVYAPTTDAEETEVNQLYEGLEDLLELTPKKDILFIIRD